MMMMIMVIINNVGAFMVACWVMCSRSAQTSGDNDTSKEATSLTGTMF